MFGHNIKIDRDLHQRLEKAAELQGYASTQEFVVHTLERAAAGIEDDVSEDEVRKRLEGLGYLG